MKTTADIINRMLHSSTHSGLCAFIPMLYILIRECLYFAESVVAKREVCCVSSFSGKDSKNVIAVARAWYGP